MKLSAAARLSVPRARAAFAIGVAALGLVALSRCDGEPEVPEFDVLRAWRTTGRIAAVDFSQDGRTVLLADANDDSALWMAPWQQGVVLGRMPGGLLTARFVRGDAVLLASGAGVIELRAARDGAQKPLADVGLVDEAQRVGRASPSGRFVAFDARIYDTQAQRWVAQESSLAGQTVLAFAEDQAALVAGSHDARLALISLEGRATRQWRAPAEITSAAVSGDGRYVAAGMLGAVAIWGPEGSEPACSLRVQGRVSQLQLGSAGDPLAFIAGSALYVGRIDGCGAPVAIKLRQEASALAIAGDLVVVGDVQGNVYAWDNERARLVGQAPALSGKVGQILVHAGTRSVLAVSREAQRSEVKLLRIASEHER